MGLLSSIFGSSSKSNSNQTTNQTTVSSTDTRTAASDNAIAVGQDGFLDQSLSYVDRSRYADNSVTNITTADPEIAAAAIGSAQALGLGAFSLVNSGLEAQERAATQNRLLAERTNETVAQSARDSLAQTLAVVADTTAGALDLAKRGQAASSEAREGAENTIATVLAAKEGADTQITKDLLKYGAIAAAIFGAVMIFRGKK